jgi:pilus assembly protein CpaC
MPGIERRQVDRSRPMGTFLRLVRILLMTAALFTAAASGSIPVAAAVIIPTTQDMVIEVNQGHLLRMDRAASAIFIANSAIAEVAVRSPRLIFVFAKKPGVTTLYAVDENENVLASIRLVVTHNLAELQDALDLLFRQKPLSPD